MQGIRWTRRTLGSEVRGDCGLLSDILRYFSLHLSWLPISSLSNSVHFRSIILGSIRDKANCASSVTHNMVYR